MKLLGYRARAKPFKLMRRTSRFFSSIYSSIVHPNGINKQSMHKKLLKRHYKLLQSLNVCIAHNKREFCSLPHSAILAHSKCQFKDGVSNFREKHLSQIVFLSLHFFTRYCKFVRIENATHNQMLNILCIVIHIPVCISLSIQVGFIIPTGPKKSLY